MDNVIETLKSIFDFLLATIAGLVVFFIIFSGVIALGHGIGYCEKIFPEQKVAFFAAYSVEYFMLLLETILLAIYYSKHFQVAVNKIWNHGAQK